MTEESIQTGPAMGAAAPPPQERAGGGASAPAPTSLSAGAVIRSLLLADEAVAACTRKVFPVSIDTSAELPYVLYRRAALEQQPQKSGQPGDDTVVMEVDCLAATYTGSVELAEAVRSALDFVRGEAAGLRLRACRLTDSEETWEDDAYVQRLVFNVKISRL